MTEVRNAGRGNHRLILHEIAIARGDADLHNWMYHVSPDYQCAHHRIEIYQYITKRRNAANAEPAGNLVAPAYKSHWSHSPIDSSDTRIYDTS